MKVQMEEAMLFWLLCCGGPNLGSLSSWIARWIKKSLEVRAGANILHSFNQISRILSELSTQEVMDRAGWSSLDTFADTISDHSQNSVPLKDLVMHF